MVWLVARKKNREKIKKTATKGSKVAQKKIKKRKRRKNDPFSESLGKEKA